MQRRRRAVSSNTWARRAAAASSSVASRGAPSVAVEHRWNGLFQDVYCINLDRRPERWEFMQAQFARLGMDAKRFAAVDGRSVDVHKLAELGLITDLALQRYLLPDSMKLFGFDLTAGAVGCALSHLFIWKDIVTRVHGQL